MATPKPKGRDYPLSTTPEPINSLSLSRANQLERRTPEKIMGDSRTKYEREILPVTQIKRGSKLGGFQQDSVMNKAWERRAAGYQAADAKQKKIDMPQAKANEAEERSQGRYKIPTKKKR